MDLPLPSTRLEVGSKERERERERPCQTGSLPPSFLVLFGSRKGLHTLALDFVSRRSCELYSLSTSRFINSNGPLTKDLCPFPDLVLLSFGRHPSSVPSSPSRVSWYRDANNCSLAYPH